MNEKGLRILEYHKIIDKLVEKASSYPGKELCRALLPSTDAAEIELWQANTADALTRLFRGLTRAAGQHRLFQRPQLTVMRAERKIS